MNSRILIVDDEPTVHFTLGALLQHQGYQVITMEMREEAFERLVQLPFDLLLLDLMLVNGVSGFAIAQYAQVVQPHARIIVMTGSLDLDDLSPDHPVHQYEQIIKNTGPGDMLNLVASCLERSQHTHVAVKG